VTPTGKLTSTVTPPHSTIATSGRPTPTRRLPTAAATPATSPVDPGLNFGFAGTSNTHFGENANILRVNLYGIGNNTVANNGLGINPANPAKTTGQDLTDPINAPSPAPTGRRLIRNGADPALTIGQDLLNLINAPFLARTGRPLIANGANGAPGTGQPGAPGGWLLGDGGAGGSGAPGQNGGNGGPSGLTGYAGAGGAGGPGTATTRVHRWQSAPAQTSRWCRSCWATRPRC
jgi:hypothetical protein